MLGFKYPAKKINVCKIFCLKKTRYAPCHCEGWRLNSRILLSRGWVMEATQPCYAALYAPNTFWWVVMATAAAILYYFCLQNCIWLYPMQTQLAQSPRLYVRPRLLPRAVPALDVVPGLGWAEWDVRRIIVEMNSDSHHRRSCSSSCCSIVKHLIIWVPFFKLLISKWVLTFRIMCKS